MAFTPDPCELIAAAMVTYLNDAARAFDLTVTTQVPDDPSAELKRETNDLRVLLVPVGDTEEKISRGTLILATYRVNVITIKPLEAGVTRAILNGFVYAMKKSLRGVTMAGYTWSGTETLTKFDPDQLRESDQYLAAFAVDYTATER